MGEVLRRLAQELDEELTHRFSVADRQQRAIDIERLWKLADLLEAELRKGEAR